MKVFYLGGDVSKGYADFVLLDAQKQAVTSAFQLDDTFEGHGRLYSILEEFLSEHPDAELCAGFESTGGYENNWIGSLRRFQASLPVRVARLNPSFVCNYARAQGTRVTTDTVSAEQVAGFLIAHADKVDYDQEDDLCGLRSQCRFIGQLIEQRKALRGQLESLLYRAHPGLIPHVTSSMPVWALKLLKRYPTAERLARARSTTLAQIPFVTEERAEQLIAAAQQSVASAGDPATEHLVREIARQLLHLRRLIKKQKEALSRYLLEADERLAEDVALLKSFDGIADYAAAGLLLEIQSAERFASAKKIASFFGVHPAFKKSGDGMSVVRMSKQGSPRMRALLFMVTLNAVQNNPLIAPLYARLVEEQGMKRIAAIGVCMHKTLRVLYGLLKHRTPFEPEVDQHNRHRSRSASSPSTDRSRRYQPYDPSAPVSARAGKRRRQQKHSQSALDAVNGMSTSTAASQNQRRRTLKSLSSEKPHGA